MSTATAPGTAAPTTPPPAARMTAVDIACALMASNSPPWRLTLTGLTWKDYQRLLDARAAAGRRAVRITYSRGEVEIMTVGNRHERWKKMLAMLIETFLIETRVPFLPSGGLTIGREGQESGFEPDECYYLRNAARAAGTRDLDFSTDPPPDLAVEVEVSRDVRGRLPLYAAVGVPEVWRCDGSSVAVLTLRPDRTYAEAAESAALPGFPLPELPRFLRMADHLDYGDAVRQFRELLAAKPT